MFYNIGLAGKNWIDARNWTMRTFGRLRELLGHTEATVDILKIDVEHAEWDSLEAMLTDGSLHYVKQLMFEFHTKELKRIGGVTTSQDYAYYWLLFSGLEELGFKIWQFVPNWCCEHKRCCGLVYMLNVNYI